MDNNLDHIIIGTKLKSFRQEASMTLTKAASSIGVSAAFISMVENGKCGISFSKLHALLTCYSKNLSDLSDTPTDGSTLVNIKKANVIAAEDGVRILGLAKNRTVQDIGGFYLYYEPGAQNEFDYHTGMDYVFVVDGEFELSLRDDAKNTTTVHKLTSGDTMIYAAILGHSYKNVGSKTGMLMIIEIGK